MMRYFNWIGGILMVAVAAYAIYAVNNYGNVPTNEHINTMMKYLEDKYDEKFVVEEYLKGSKLFPKFLGTDMIRVHPKKMPSLAFYTLLKEDDVNCEDFYPDAYYSYAYSRKHEQPILEVDSRQKYVQMHVQSTTVKMNQDLIGKSFEAIVQDEFTPDLVYCYVVVEVDENFDISNEAKLIAKTYNTIKEATEGDFIINVGFVLKPHFEEGVEMTRSGHAYSVDLSMLMEGHAGHLIFQRDDANANDEAYFSK